MQQAIAEKDLVAMITGDGSFKILLHALRSTGIIDVLRRPDTSYTLFAPNDKAFQGLSADGTLHDLLKDRPRLTRVIDYHILPGRVLLARVDGRSILRTRAVQPLVIDMTGEPRVNAARVCRADIECANGILHEIDAVLLPK
jgi:uncharacterized surface protein with fasciclin (FAS1) repeats